MDRHIDAKYAPKNVSVGDTLIVYSREKKAWCAKLSSKNKKYGRDRDFLCASVEHSGMSKQIVTYSFTIEEPGEYELAGNEFGDFRYTFKVKD